MSAVPFPDGKGGKLFLHLPLPCVIEWGMHTTSVTFPGGRRRQSRFFTLAVAFVTVIGHSLFGQESRGAGMILNGGYEQGAQGWRTWARAAGTLTAGPSSDAHTGKSSLLLKHSGAEEWSLEPEIRIPVQVGQMFELECWVRLRGTGSATLCFSTWDAAGKPTSWTYGSRIAQEREGWQHLVSRIVVPAGVVQIQPRLIGYRPSQVWVDDYSLVTRGNVGDMRRPDLPTSLKVSNRFLEVTLDTREACFAIRDRRNQRSWLQKPFAPDLILKDARKKKGRLECLLLQTSSGLDLTASLWLEPNQAEAVMELKGSGELEGAIQFPHPFVSPPGHYLVVPMNEGISYPVEDASIPPMHLIAYGGHGISMAFYGVTDGSRGQMTILETPNDASIRIERLEGRLTVLPQWDPELGKFGYTRKARLVFFEKGGHVAMAKRYRAYAREIGLLKTLTEKRKENPNVDLLIGAVNTWCWDRDSVPIVREMQSAGIDRILWSNQQSEGNLRALNELGVLTSRYDIYQDVMAVTNFARLQWIHPDWTSNAWPNDIILDPWGQWIKGWGVETRDGGMIPCGVICDRQALPYARERIPADLATRPYRCRFIDTTTANPWNECYHPDHPMTRTESRKWKMELLRYVSADQKLVTGCETGHDAAVPFLHYFEGMLSLGPYRVPDAGRRMQEIWTTVPENVAKFQLGHAYRLPLWELVYHDCVVAQWYWGDYNNKLPALWDKRDLFNLLYGTPPMFMFHRRLWEQNKDRFVQSYRNTCPHIRKIGYEEMTDHRFLTSDRAVQQTVFRNGTQITVNFGSVPFRMPDGSQLLPLGFLAKDRR